MLARLKNAAKVQAVSLEPLTIQPHLAPNLGTKHLSETRFSSESDVETTSENWFSRQGRDFYQARLKKLALHSDKCRNRFADYVEK
ncbi:hypothetical protein AVEN_246785-1 [Araneus ventricosus]|uniref:DUF4817 domain-containing protein n=1 Tax=Araneus ventricosus TaxID=182803 RepID=A0A4Y2SBJ4_ARAVE|nr:hypothetical protein AVEN_246785-1 [Araneus ventricosus]